MTPNTTLSGYTAWRITYQSSEAAAQAAYTAYIETLEQLRLAEIARTAEREARIVAEAVDRAEGEAAAKWADTARFA